MGDKAFSVFQSDLKLEIGDFGGVPTYLDDWVNAAYVDFCTREYFWDLKVPAKFFFPELLKIDVSKATAANTKYVSVPTGLIAVYHIHDTTNDVALDYLEVQEYARKTGRSTSASYGKPTKWTRIGSKFYFYPTPDAAYNLEVFYRAKPSLLVNSTDTTEIDSLFDDPILKLAVIQTLMRLKRYDAAEMEKKEWLSMVAAKMGLYNRDKKSGKTPLQPDYAYKIMGRP
jgi:hypothetical protein